MTLGDQEVIDAKYQILHKMREGGMGTIYKVRHLHLDEIMVIKSMRRSVLEGELPQRFLLEAKNAIRLQHENVARVFDYSVDPDQGIAFIVMEYVDGISLDDMLATSGAPSIGLTMEIARQCLGAIGHLHSHGIIHRDISADNFLLARDEPADRMVKLIDLGIAKVEGKTTGLTSTGVFVGKLKYSSPEQFSTGDPKKFIDRRSDLYSFGVLLYRLLTARFPIEGRDLREIGYAHLTRPPLDFRESDPSGRVPVGLRELVMRALAKRPDERIGSAAEFAQRLAPFQRPGPHDQEIKRILIAAETLPDELSYRQPGSRQEKLDEQGSAERTVLTRVTAVDDAKQQLEEAGRGLRGASRAFVSLAALLARTAGALGSALASLTRAFATLPIVARLGVLAGVVVLAALVVWPLSQQTPAREEAKEIEVPPPPTILPVVTPTGVLLVNAIPWAEVVSIRSSDGPVDLPEEAYTPLRLELPAGPVFLRLTHPSLEEPVELDATVVAGAITVAVPLHFETLSARQYFNRLGW